MNILCVMLLYFRYIIKKSMKTMKKKVFFLAMLAFSGSWGRESQEKTLKIGIVNSVIVQDGSKELKEVAEKCSASMQTLVKSFEKLKTEVEAKAKKTQSIASSLKPGEFEKRMNECRTEYANGCKDIEQKEAVLKKEAENANVNFQRQLLQSAQDVAQQKGVDIVLDRSSLLYVSDSVVNLTEDVIQDMKNQSKNKLSNAALQSKK
jgi:Skp family chaperone for outer membrane proteins